MAKSYLASKGDIRTVLRTLFSSPEFMAPEAVGAKFKTPYQFVISAARAGNLQLADTRKTVGILTRLGMPLYGCQTPDGYKNTQDAWLNPDALNRRIAFATQVGQYVDAQSLQATLGGSLSPKTLGLVAGSAQAMRSAMLLGSPDFMQH